MNHRKLEHPSKKICRYFLKQECVFDAESCWYVHKTENINNEGDTCNECGLFFEDRNNFMKHKKNLHVDQVAKCVNFINGN